MIFGGIALLTRIFYCAVLCVAIGIATPARSAENEPRRPDGWHWGVGSSEAADPLQAGDEAAGRAKAALGDHEAKFVLVNSVGALMTPQLIDGVAKHFPRAVIHGGEVTNPWTPDGNNPESKVLDAQTGVGVWALGGDMEITVAMEETPDAKGDDDPYHEAGAALAQKLKSAMEDETRPGRLMITWGDQFGGSNQSYAEGLNDGFGEVRPIVGGASGSGEAKEVFEGTIHRGVNIGVVIAGDFTVGMARSRGAHQPETVASAIEKAWETSEAGEGEDPFFALFFNCRRRRQAMIDAESLAGEHSTVLRLLPGKQFFGAYGPGQIGPKETGGASEGVGFHVVAALLFAK